MIVLVTGGSGSGKSELAEGMAARLCPGVKYYVATMIAWGEEGQKRVERHRRLRAGKGFETIERPVALIGAPVPFGATALVECVSNLLANEMFDPSGAGEACVRASLDGLFGLAGRCAHLVIVTNEIFSDGTAYDESTARYVRALGEVNRALAARADVVVEAVCGLPLLRKGRAFWEDSL